MDSGSAYVFSLKVENVSVKFVGRGGGGEGTTLVYLFWGRGSLIF